MLHMVGSSDRDLVSRAALGVTRPLPLGLRANATLRWAGLAPPPPPHGLSCECASWAWRKGFPSAEGRFRLQTTCPDSHVQKTCRRRRHIALLPWRLPYHRSFGESQNSVALALMWRGGYCGTPGDAVSTWPHPALLPCAIRPRHRARQLSLKSGRCLSGGCLSELAIQLYASQQALRMARRWGW